MDGCTMGRAGVRAIEGDGGEKIAVSEGEGPVRLGAPAGLGRGMGRGAVRPGVGVGRVMSSSNIGEAASGRSGNSARPGARRWAGKMMRGLPLEIFARPVRIWRAPD